MVLRDLYNLKLKQAKIKKDLEKGIESLCANKELVIRPANKGGGIIVLDKNDYMK